MLHSATRQQPISFTEAGLLWHATRICSCLPGLFAAALRFRSIQAALIQDHHHLPASLCHSVFFHLHCFHHFRLDSWCLCGTHQLARGTWKWTLSFYWLSILPMTILICPHGNVPLTCREARTVSRKITKTENKGPLNLFWTTENPISHLYTQRCPKVRTCGNPKVPSYPKNVGCYVRKI